RPAPGELTGYMRSLPAAVIEIARDWSEAYWKAWLGDAFRGIGKRFACPFHDDRNPSACLWRDKAGCVHFVCFSESHRECGLGQVKFAKQRGVSMLNIGEHFHVCHVRRFPFHLSPRSTAVGNGLQIPVSNQTHG